jgi:broad specificity phosphatase PhoE
MKLIFTRHGETKENAEGIIQGHLPGRLSETGKAQAVLLARRLKEEQIDYIYSSDLARSADTAREIAKYHPAVPIEFVKELRERDYGSFQGKRKTEIDYDRWKVEIQSPGVGREGAETLEGVCNRASSFLEKTLQRHRNQTVLYVGHGGMGRILVAIILHKSFEEIRRMPRIENASISIFEINENKKHELHLLNDVRHLDPERERRFDPHVSTLEREDF